MEYFKIADKYFKRINHYKYRNPPWIKLHNDFLEDYHFSKLPDQKKYHFIAVLLLATRNENKIIYDDLWITGKINASSKIDLQVFLEHGFIEKIEEAPQEKSNENKEIDSDASKAQADCKQDDSEVLLQSKRESRVEKSREEESALSRANLLYNFKTKEFSIEIDQVYHDELKKHYPRANVLHEIRKMNQWYCDHPEAKITFASFKAHVRKWISRENDDVFEKCKHCGKEIQKPREYCYECENKKKDGTKIKNISDILQGVAHG